MGFLKSYRGTSKITSMLLAFMLFVVTVQAQAADTIKVGILHSLSGTMAISETSLRDVALMAIEEINAKGVSWAKSLSRWSLIPLQIGPCLQRKPVS